MNRKHLFEIEDQDWCPSIIRESLTDFLCTLYKVFQLFTPAYQKIEEILIKTKTNTIIDCCSGSGGPIALLRDYLDKRQMHNIKIILTDKFPNLAQFAKLEQRNPGRIIGYKQPVDACQIPTALKGVRCFFTSFHHFRPEQAVAILQNAVDNNEAIVIFEASRRHILDFIRALISPLLMLSIIPFSKTLNWRKFLLTYILPITPFVFQWDYFVSNIRTYSSKEMRLLISKVNAPHYSWEIGKLKTKKAKSTLSYLIGSSTNPPI